MLVDGIPLHKTNIAIDPKTPVKVSEVEVLFREQSKYKVSSIYMKDLMYGKHYLANLMKDCVKAGSRITFVDEQQEHLEATRARFTSPKKPGGGSSTGLTRNDIMSIKDPGERQNAIARNLVLFGKGD